MLEHLHKSTKPKSNTLVKACIGQEAHEDGGSHLHVCAWYSKPLHFYGAHHLDIKDADGNNYHPNIKNTHIKRVESAISYCTKTDKDPLLFNMDLKQETTARKNHSKILTADLVSGKRTLTDMVKDGDISLQDLPKWE